MADENEEIRLRITADAKDIVEKTKEAQAEIRRLKGEVEDLAKKASASFRVAGDQMVKAFATEKWTKFFESRGTLGSKEKISEAMRIVKAEVAEYQNKISQAVAQAQQEETANFKALQTQELALEKATLDRVKKTTAAEKAAAKEREAEHKQRMAFQKEEEKAAAKVATPLPTISKEEIAANFRAQVDQMKSQIMSFAATSKISFKEAADSMIREFTRARQATLPSGKTVFISPQAAQEVKEYTNTVNAALKEVQREANKTQSVFSRLGSALGRLGIFVGLAQVFRTAINFIKEATQSALEFSRALFSIEMGVRALQRAGTDITFKDVQENIAQLRKEFGIFSQKELIEGTGSLLNLVRSLGLTKDQILEVQRATAILATVNGRSMGEVQDMVARFLASGYTEGMQKLGVSINLVNVGNKAQEMGWSRNYRALTEYQRAQAAVAVLMEKMALYEEDYQKMQETTFGQLQKHKSAWTDLKQEIGQRFLPVWEFVVRGLVNGATLTWQAIQIVLTLFGKLVAFIAGPLVKAALLADYAWKKIKGEDVEFNIQDILKKAGDVQEQIRDFFSGENLYEQLLGDTGGAKDAIKEFTEEQLESYKSLFDELLDLSDDHAEKMTDLERDFLSDLAEIDREYSEERKDIWADYYKEVAKINADAQDDIKEAEEDLAADIADLNRDTQTSIQDANRKYRENEVKAERDYQEKLRRLREEFLFDLEDALREQDALQVLRLMRRYNLDKSQLAREQENEDQERAEQHQQEIADIRRQADERLQELQREHQQRLQEIEEQKQKELAEAAKQREEELAQAKEDWVKEREERQKQYQEDLADLKEWLEERLVEIVKKFGETEGATKEMANSVAKVIRMVFGRGGQSDRYFKEFSSIIDAAVAKAKTRTKEMESLLAQVNSMYSQLNTTVNNASNTTGGTTPETNPTPGYIPENWTPPYAGGHASGGSLLVTRPKMFMAGEVPEKIDIVPLSQLNSQKIGSAKGGGKGVLEIQLSPGLRAQIVDNALDEFDIILRTELSKKL